MSSRIKYKLRNNFNFLNKIKMVKNIYNSIKGFIGP